MSQPDVSKLDPSSLDASNTDLSITDLSITDLSITDLSNTDLSNTAPSNTDLSNTAPSNTDLSNTDLSNTDLSNTDLSNTDLSNPPSHDPGTRTSHDPIGTARIIALVAKRELTTRARTKSFLISNAVILVLILGGIIAASIFGGGSASQAKLGLVGTASGLSGQLSATAKASENPLDISMLPTAAAARAKVASGDLDAALVPRGPDGYTAIVATRLPIELRLVIESVAQQQAVSSALTARGVDPAALSQAVGRATVTVDAVDPPDPDSDQRSALAFLAMMLMFFQILMFGLYVAMGVVEEKSSRVVEVLLATIKPLHLFTGKIVGIGAVGLAQLAAFGVVGLGAGIGTGLVTVTGVAVGVLASVLVWFILGFAFYAAAYAAAGSMVSRQEEVNSTTTPITMLVLASYILAQITVAEPDGTVAEVMSWIPPFSAMLMPLRIAAGTTNLAQIIGSALLMVLAAVALTMLAARIYERSVLRTGKRVSWKDALRIR